VLQIDTSVNAGYDTREFAQRDLGGRKTGYFLLT